MARKQVTSEEAMRLIKNEEEPEMKPLVSDADVGPLDPDKFAKEVFTKRKLMKGEKLDIVAPKESGKVLVPTFRMALVKEFSSLPRSWKRKMTAMFAVGAGEAEVMAKFGIPRKVWDEWLVKEGEFAEVVSAGMVRSQAWWEEQARAYVSQPAARFNAALWYMNMKNRFGYRDQKELNVKETRLVGHVILPPMEVDPRAESQTTVRYAENENE